MFTHWFGRKKSNNAIRVRCRHEACHAVVAMAYGLPVEHIEVRPHSGSGGSTHWRTMPAVAHGRYRSRGAVVEDYMKFLAVMVAADVGTIGVDEHRERSCCSDALDAAALAQHMVASGIRPEALAPDCGPDSLLSLARLKALEKIEKHAAVVDRITELLLRNQELSFETLDPIAARVWAEEDGRF
ncbi:hypothetical protein KRX51_02845 [Corynebacterium sp. TAE3-ERU12]|uniref:hypothetical protein n=1 Tax=Corynebacterium sp. TAE3-ERU12 TaxID=2849491 RepID=UPI001C43F95E|nr:hypothetical protein [Corynebacterium sp. TAE3-ERU12]MBV7294858.1 hypothetical protein [Corynebacterium sp. TAE3-ERU12]